MQDFHWITNLVFLADWMLRIGLSARVVMRRLPVGVSLAWLAIILIFPFAGAAVYLLLGEYRLGHGRMRRAAIYRENNRPVVVHRLEVHRADVDRLDPESAALARLADSVLGQPPLRDNRLHLLENAAAAFPALIADIDRARQTVNLEYYIWSPGGQADEVGAAVIRAAKRGVQCRILVDAVGSKAFLKSTLSNDLRQSGVRVGVALPTGLLRLLFVRPDLRLHRKIVVVDEEIGYTGSLNMADPRFFKIEAGVGQWVDAFARVEGPAVKALMETFREDWAIETGESIEPAPSAATTSGSQPASKAVIQVLPTGPAARVDAIEQIVLMAIYAASREVVLTTPYFVPSESMLNALLSAAGRGVDVSLIVPAKVDSRLVHFASRAYQTDLIAAGVRVALFKGGLLHTKSITVDGRFSLFGSLNLDPRSLRLDFEITLAIYDVDFTTALRQLQSQYLSNSTILDLASCKARSGFERFKEDAARLLGPIL
ncbi:MAG TPA: cardiolipin synthase [Gemmataceae bacterium]|nr:cardiolipin synthase [Gemmataceae bacterium]